MQTEVVALATTAKQSSFDECPWSSGKSAKRSRAPLVPQRKVIPTYTHSSTQLEDGESMLADTGSPDNISGMDHVLRQSRIAGSLGKPVVYEKLTKPKYIGGIGEGIITCVDQAILPACLEDGTEMKYAVACIPGNVEGDSPTPCIYGLDSMAEMHT